jgi:alkaline phosphatase
MPDIPGKGQRPAVFGGRHLPDGAVTCATTQHTNELVTLYAHGALDHKAFKRAEGAWYPCTRIIDNTQLYHLMAEAAGPARCGRRDHHAE